MHLLLLGTGGLLSLVGGTVFGVIALICGLWEAWYVEPQLMIDC